MVVGYPTVHWRGTTYTYDANDQFLLRIVPRIDSISQSTGSKLGGQEVTLQGSGFTTNSEHIPIVKINHETECKVT